MATAQKTEVLSAGAFSTVHLCLFRQSAFPFATPVKFAVKSSELRTAETLKRETMFLKSLKGCPYIVQGFGEDESIEEEGIMVYNLLMEYTPGGTLAGVIKFRGGKMSELEISSYTYQLVRGIREVHRIKAVHCDLTPDNMLIFPGLCGNLLKLADFGLSKFESEVNNPMGDHHAGCLTYASPESLLHKNYSAPKDIWALGCIVFEMITGKPLRQSHLDDSTPTLISKIENTRPEIPDGVVSDYARDFLEKCLDMDPSSRWTAERLLSHPFIARHHNPTSDQPGVARTERNWSSYKGLFCNSFFSSSIPPPGFEVNPPFKQYSLF